MRIAVGDEVECCADQKSVVDVNITEVGVI